MGLLLLGLFVALCAGMGQPRFSKHQLRAANTCRDEGVDPGTPLLLTPLVQQGRYSTAKTLSKASLHGTDLGHSGFLTVRILRLGLVFSSHGHG
jgi:hypothetical protein